jgi:hypothetical protein
MNNTIDLNELEVLIDSLEKVNNTDQDLICARLTQLNDVVRTLSNERRRSGISDHFYKIIHKLFVILSESKNVNGIITLMKIMKNSAAVQRDSFSSAESEFIKQLTLLTSSGLSDLIYADSLSSPGVLINSLQYIFNLTQGIAI